MAAIKAAIDSVRSARAKESFITIYQKLVGSASADNVEC
jgi:hypothetical protein